MHHRKRFSALRSRRTFSVTVVLAFMLFLTAGAGQLRAQGVTPAKVNLTLGPGESTVVHKQVETPAAPPPKLDVYFLADTTGSMGGAINNVKANASSILSDIQAGTPDSQFGVGDYKDFDDFDSYAFNSCTGITGDAGGAVTNCINGWSADGGDDTPEGQLFALHQIATGAGGFRAGATKVLVWFGDAPGHDPICASVNGTGVDVSESSATSELVSAGIKVIAISVDTGSNGLDGNPMDGLSNYYGAHGCAPGGPRVKHRGSPAPLADRSLAASIPPRSRAPSWPG